MTIRRQVVIAAAAAALLLGGPAAAQEVKGEEHVLPNGMKLLLVQRPDEPTVSAGWVAKVGSVNERVGITGISHLFEHMMFKGTTTIGSKDPKRDLEIIAEQEKLRDEMRAEESKMRAAFRRGDVDDITKPESRTARYKELDAKFDVLVKEQRDLLVKNEFDRIYTKNGASGMNAFTTYDMTGYFITVPKNKLELWFWMESDRLRDPVFREFYAERDVVYEERRLSVESTPTGTLDEAFESIFWHSTPYTWPVIGYASDVANITKAAGRRLLRDLLRPEQPDGRPRRRLRQGRGAEARRRVLRADPAREGPAPRGHHAPDEVAVRPPLRGGGRHEPHRRDALAHRPLPAQGLLRPRGPRRAPERPDRPPLQGDGPPGRRRRDPGFRVAQRDGRAREVRRVVRDSAPRRRRGRRPPRSRRRSSPRSSG